MASDAQDGSGAGLRRPLLGSEAVSHAVELVEPYGDGYAEADVGPPAQTRWAAYLEALGEKLGLESAAEGRVCFWLGLQAHLANSVFTIGRNIGPTLFIAKAGAAQLPVVMFASGVAVLATGPLFARFSRGKRAARTNRDFSLFTAAALLLLPIPLAVSQPGSPVALACAYALFLAEDLLPMLLMMQSSSLAQSSLTGHAAKRLLGLIQLGCSTGAMSAGLAIGPLARRLGASNLLVIQSALLALSLYPNAEAWEYEDFDDEAYRHKAHEANATRQKNTDARNNKTDAGQKKTDAGPKSTGAPRGVALPPDQAGPGWGSPPVSPEELPLWRSPLLVALALNTVGIIMAKTIVEFQYNVLVSDALSVESMVTLTGQLYAAAGLAASLLNVLGSPMLRSLGITSTLLLCPAALCLSALAFASAPVVPAAFVGRLVDLTLRWSINNSTKSLLWIATPRELQIRGKPIIEGLVKKATASLTALIIGLVALLPVPQLRTLALLSAAVSAAACAVCYASGRLYHSAVWSQIEKRELVLKEDDETYGRHYGSSGLVEFEATVELNASMAEQVLDKLRTSPPQVQLYILRGMGDRLPDSAWRRFLEPSIPGRAGNSPGHPRSPRSPRGSPAPAPAFCGFDSLAPEVQIEALHICERMPARLSNQKLLQILELHCYDPNPWAPGAHTSSPWPSHRGVSYEPPLMLPPIIRLPPSAVEANSLHGCGDGSLAPAWGWGVAPAQREPRTRAAQPGTPARPPTPQNLLGPRNSVWPQNNSWSQNGLGPQNSLAAQNSLGPASGAGEGRTTERVAAVAILAVGGRRLQIAEPVLARLLESKRAALRGAAAAALLLLGWGVGLGHLTTTALAVLQSMAGVPLGETGDAMVRVETPDGGEQARGCDHWLAACPDSAPPDPSSHAAPNAASNTIPQLLWPPARPGTGVLVEQLSTEVVRLTVAWDDLSARDPAAAMPLALRLTRFKGMLAAARAAADTAGGGRPAPGPHPAARRNAASDRLVAVNMMQALPASLLPVSSLLTLLHSDSMAVRRAALPLLRPPLAALPSVELLDALITAALACAENTHTEHRARRALWGLAKHGGAAVAARVIEQAEERLRVLVGAARGGWAPGQGGEEGGGAGGVGGCNGGGGGAGGGEGGGGGVCGGIFRCESVTGCCTPASGRSRARETGAASPDCAQAAPTGGACPGEACAARAGPGGRGHPSVSYAGATRVRGLCGVLCEIPGGEGVAERLLAMSASLHDPEIVHELLDALMQLWPRRPAPTNVNLEAEIRQQARTLLFGFFVLSWLRAPAPALSPPSAARLASALGLPPSLAQSIADASPPTPAVAATAAIPSSASASSLPRAAPPPASFRTAAADPAAALRSLASDYATERQYLQRLRLFKLSMLWRQSDSSIPGGGLGGIPGRGLGRAAGGLAPSKVLAAWRVLRSDDPKAASAALEVLETTLAPRLAALVLPLVNDAVPLERKLRVSAAAGRPEQGWMSRWFEQTLDPLGRELAPLCAWLRSATGRRGAAAVIQARARERRASTAARAAHASSPAALPERPLDDAPSLPLPPPATLPTLPPLASPDQTAPAPTSSGGVAVGVLASAGVRPAAAIPASPSEAGFPPPTSGLVARVLLLRGSRLFRGVLTLHVAAVAQAAAEVALAQGERFTRSGASYFLMEGRACRVPGEECLTTPHAPGGSDVAEAGGGTAGSGFVPASSEAARAQEGGEAAWPLGSGPCVSLGTSFSAPPERETVAHPLSLAPSAAPHGSPAREYGPGDAIQELGCFDHTLPVVPCTATCASRCVVLPPGMLWHLILTLPPKFGLSLLRALVTFAPSASHGAAGLQKENAGLRGAGRPPRRGWPAAAAGRWGEAAGGCSADPGCWPTGGVTGGGGAAAGIAGGEVGGGSAGGGGAGSALGCGAQAWGAGDTPRVAVREARSETLVYADGLAAADAVKAAPGAVNAHAVEVEAVEAAAAQAAAAESEAGEAGEEGEEGEGEVGVGAEVVAGEVEGESHGPVEWARTAFSRDERAWLLRQVKLLRFVHRRFIPSLADIVSELRLSPGQRVCSQGDPTPARLFIVAHGALQLWRSPAPGAPPVLLRELTPGDSLGNTGLIADGVWEYTAVAAQDSWALTIARDDLADLLRGRSDLSLSVLKGFYLTFVRRLTQVLEQEGRYSRNWLLAADVDKSPVPMHRRGQQLHQ